MNGTFVGDLEQATALLRIELPAQRDRPLDAIEHAFLGLAVFAISGVNPGMGEFDRHPLEWKRLALGIEPQRHRRAGS